MLSVAFQRCQFIVDFNWSFAHCHQFIIYCNISFSIIASTIYISIYFPCAMINQRFYNFMQISIYILDYLVWRVALWLHFYFPMSIFHAFTFQCSLSIHTSLYCVFIVIGMIFLDSTLHKISLNQINRIHTWKTMLCTFHFVCMCSSCWKVSFCTLELNKAH